MSRAEQKNGARILSIDIETLPMLFYAWQPWEARALKVLEDTSVCAWSAKWLGGRQITKCLADYKGYKAHSRDDRKLLAELWPLLDEADIVVAHNGKRFDVKKLNYRFMVLGLGVPSPYQVVDTLLEIKKVASFDSHRLNDLSQSLEIGQKVRTGGADLWFDCIEGKPAAWKRMKVYNARDVALLERLYLKIRPWMQGHPNMGLFSGLSCCPKCGSVKLQARGWARSSTRSYQRFHCQACGGWAKGTESFRDKRASLTNIPR